MTQHRATVSSILAAAAYLTGAALGGSARADTCSEAYAKALGDIAKAHDGTLGQAASSLRQPVEGMPGRWIVGSPGEARGKGGERPCLETAVSRGRERCVRYGVPLPREVEAKARPSTEEQRIVAQLGEIVLGRGAPAEFQANGRSTAVVTRVAGEVRNYLGQGTRATLCTGGREVTQFYAGHTAPIGRRLDEVKQLAEAARKLAAARIQDLAVADAPDLTAKAQAKASEAAPSGATPATPAPAAGAGRTP